MKLMATFATAVFSTALLSLAPAHAGGDPVAGKKVFNKCMACHDATTENNKVGPTLLGVLGRTAGTVESFQSKYSDAMKKAGAGGLVWDEANITEYLKAPKTKVPGNKMTLPGLKDDADIANVIAYLEANPKP